MRAAFAAGRLYLTQTLRAASHDRYTGMGFIMTFAPLFAKLWKVSKVMTNKRLKVIKASVNLSLSSRSSSQRSPRRKIYCGPLILLMLCRGGGPDSKHSCMLLMLLVVEEGAFSVPTSI